MGPWGLLRIKEIDGELVGAEIGMTIQLESFYPYHFHHSQEIYMNIGSLPARSRTLTWSCTGTPKLRA